MDFHTVGDPIHEGSNTLLFRGYRDADQAPVIIKVPRDIAAPREAERLRHEHEILQAIDVPGVVKALALEPSDKGLSLVLEALPGEPLSAVLRARRLDVTTALTIAHAGSSTGISSRTISFSIAIQVAST